MSFRGDVGGNYAARIPHGTLICMPTAIAFLYTPPGFVIAADGRKRDSETHLVISDDAQKIFEIPGMQVGYALMGTVELSPEGSNEITVNFCEQIMKSVEDLEQQKFKDLHGYATELSMSINERLADARRTGMIGPYPAKPSRIPGPGFDIVRLFLNGYFIKVNRHA